MDIFIELPIYTNILFLFLLVTLNFSTRLKAASLVFGWAAVNLIYIYFLFGLTGGSDPMIGFYGLQIPQYSSLVIVLVILALGTKLGEKSGATLFLRLTILSLATASIFMRNLEGTGYLADRIGLKPYRILYMSMFVISFQVGVLAPLVSLIDEKKSLASSLFSVSAVAIRENYKTIVSCTIGFLLIWAISGAVVKGSLIHFYLISPFNAFSLTVAFSLFYYSLLDQFLCFGLAKLLMDNVFPDEETTMWEVFVYAMLFAAFHHYIQPGLIVREFFLGLVLAYMYLKTKSLSYGILLHSLIWIFTIPI